MGTTKLNIGKIPISKGEYHLGTTYQRLNQVTMLGSTYQSKIDDNTSAPAQMDADGVVENINTDKWLCIAVGNVSAAKKVVYNNETSGLEAGNVQEAIDEVGSKVSDLSIKDEEGNVQDNPFKVIENEEFIMAVVDSEDRTLFGVYRDSGKPYFPLNEMYHVIQNEEYLAAWLDADDKVLLGIRRDGKIIGEIQAVNYLKQAISTIRTNVTSLQKGKVDKEKGKSLIDDEVANSLKVIENEEFIYAITDAEYKILEGTDIEGRKYIDTLIVQHLQIKDKNNLHLESFVDLIYESEKINSDVTLFTQETVKEDDVLFVEFKSNSSPFCIRFNDKNGNRLNWCGISGNIPNLNFKQTLVVPKNYTNAVSAWGNALNLKIYRLRKEGSDCLYSCLNNILEGNIDYMKFKEYWIPSYLKDEMLQTIDKLDRLTVKPAFVMPILTDSHVGITARSQEMTQETLACLRYLCSHCSVDAIAHLGDLVDSDVWNYFPDNVKCYTIMQNYLMQFAEINAHSYIVNGNHDGRELNSFYSSRWYSMIGRKISSDSTIIKDSEETAYYYVENTKCKLCCIFMSIPDSYNNTAPIWGWTSQQLKWFANVLANVKTGYQVMIFAHILPFEANSTNNSTHTLVNVETFYGIVNAFNNHTTYNDSLVTVDFTKISNSKIVCYFAGHEHSEKVWKAGESYKGKYTDNYKDYFDFTYVNNMPCSAVGLTETYYSYNDTISIDNMGQTLVLRKEKTALQEAWDILVYRPDLKRIYLIRFGSGEDREIDLTNLI